MPSSCSTAWIWRKSASAQTQSHQLYQHTSKGPHQRNPSEQFNVSGGVGAAGNSLTMSMLSFWWSGLGCKATHYICPVVSGRKHCAGLFSFCHSNARCMIDRFAHHEAKYSGILAYLTRSMEKHQLSPYSICTLLDDTDRVAPTMGCAVFVHIGVFSMIMN